MSFRRSLTRRATYLAAAAMVALTSLVPSAVVHALPAETPVPVLYPGGAFLQFSGETGKGASSCTAGFGVLDAGKPAFLTAGHCVAYGRNPLVKFFDLGGPPTLVGSFVHQEYILADESGARRDASEVLLSPQGAQRFDPRVGGQYVVSEVWGEDVIGKLIGKTICSWGFRTGTEQCGRVISLVPGTITVAFLTQHGDSGAPVYAHLPDGTVAAVGLVSGSPIDENSGGTQDNVTLVRTIDRYWSRWNITPMAFTG